MAPGHIILSFVFWGIFGSGIEDVSTETIIMTILKGIGTDGYNLLMETNISLIISL